jgi:hypothetical protein
MPNFSTPLTDVLAGADAAAPNVGTYLGSSRNADGTVTSLFITPTDDVPNADGTSAPLTGLTTAYQVAVKTTGGINQLKGLGGAELVAQFTSTTLALTGTGESLSITSTDKFAPTDDIAVAVFFSDSAK